MRVLLSCGGSNLFDISNAIKILNTKGIKPVLMHGFQAYPTKIEDINLNRFKLLKKQLKKEITNLEENKMNNSRVLDILEQLSKVTINTNLLASTKIGKVVNKLKNKSSNDSIVEAASKLINKWKAIARGEKSSN